MPKTTYVWDELSDNVIEEYEDGVLSVSYTHEPGLYGNLLSQNCNGVTSYYPYDGRGDTVALTDDSGNVTDTKEYDAWGNVIASSGSTLTPYLFVGRQGYQSASIGAYVRARMYLSNSSRWLSRDPQLFSDGENLYRYVHNRPINAFDSRGFFTEDSGASKDCSTRDTNFVSSNPQSGDHKSARGVNMITVKLDGGQCGYFLWGIRWEKPQPLGENGSFVLQHIRLRKRVFACCGNGCDEGIDITQSRMLGKQEAQGNADGGTGWDFYEAWQFPPGKTKPSNHYDPTSPAYGVDADDSYTGINYPNSCGVIEIVGSWTECSGAIPGTMIQANPEIPVAPLNHSSSSRPECRNPSGLPVGAPGTARWKPHSITVNWCCSPK